MPKSARYTAWRNLMVSAINAALQTERLSLSPKRPDKYPHDNDTVFSFEIDGKPAMCSLRGIGWDEVSVHACYLPTPDGAQWVRCSNPGFLAGEAYAQGWLERRTGPYLQTSHEMFKCRRSALDTLAGLTVNPLGYRDRGKVIL